MSATCARACRSCVSVARVLQIGLMYEIGSQKVSCGFADQGVRSPHSCVCVCARMCVCACTGVSVCVHGRECAQV
eukprot:2755538-Pleurochrysis_carterae.AAC.1